MGEDPWDRELCARSHEDSWQEAKNHTSRVRFCWFPYPRGVLLLRLNGQVMKSSHFITSDNLLQEADRMLDLT